MDGRDPPQWPHKPGFRGKRKHKFVRNLRHGIQQKTCPQGKYSFRNNLQCHHQHLLRISMTYIPLPSLQKQHQENQKFRPNQALCRVCRQQVEAVISVNLAVAAHQSEVDKEQRMKKELVSLSRTVKSACQATTDAKKIAKISEDLKAERELHY